MGRLLPSSVRRRIFEPAYHDLLADSRAEEHGDYRVALRVLALALESFRVGVPRLALQLFRRSRTAQVVIGTIILFLVAYIILQQATTVEGSAYAVTPHP